MKTKMVFHTTIVMCSLFAVVHGAFAQGTAFTYQGHLNNGGNAANGSYDLTFSLFNVSSGGSAVAGPVNTNGVPVSNGLFAVSMDFGAGVFNGTTYWLQIAVRTNGGGSFTNLSPRQQMTPAPYAIFAEGANAAGLSGTIPAGDLSGTYGNAVTLNNAGNSFSGNGAGLVNVNASLLGGLAASGFWQTLGNSDTTPGVNFLGTTDFEPLELHVNGSRGMRLDYASESIYIPPFLFLYSGINVNGGFWGNSISNGIVGATIAGGGQHVGPVFSGTDYPNAVIDSYGTVGGGYGNTAGNGATVPGGYLNSATGLGSFAAGRHAQTVNAGEFVWNDGSQTSFTGVGADCFDVIASGGLFLYNGAGGVNVDYLNGNNGDINYALRFGIGSGEGIGSKRTAGGNQYGLDFYTGFANRMSIANYGYVGINTTTPQQQLDVNGEFLVVDGYGNEQAYIGGDGVGNDVQVGSLNSSISAVAFYNAANNSYMHIYCSSISILGGADLAEPFAMSGAGKEIPQGAVVVIDDENPGHLRMSDAPYDTRVAGVVSGANGVNPVIQLKQQGLLEDGKNVALTGRVYVLVDASNGPIKPGDLLTTSSTPGHAMKVNDHARAQGAILGKAMTGLSEGKGMVLVLVTLQ